MDYNGEIAGILKDKNARSYSKKLLDGKERIQFSVLAEKSGLISYSQVDKDGKNPCLVISLPLDLPIDYLIKDPNVYGTFAEWLGKPIMESSDIELFEVTQEWEVFLNSLKRYGLAGLKRRTEIFMEYLVTFISNLPKYQDWINRSKEGRPVLLGEISKPFSISNKIYQPQNDNMVFISIDVKASIFQAYHELGIIPQKTWPSFIGQFASDPYLINDKKLRLKVFGKLDKNKTNSILIPNTILPFYKRLASALYSDLMIVEGDEIVFKTATDTLYGSDLKTVLDLIKVEEDYLRVSQYTLKHHPALQDGTRGSYFTRHFCYPSPKVDIKGAKQEDLRSAYIELYTTHYVHSRSGPPTTLTSS